MLGTVLEKLDLGSCSAKIDDFPTSGDSQPQANENLKEKIDQLGTTEQIYFFYAFKLSQKK